MKKVLFILASNNFRDIEYIVPRAFLEQNNIEVPTASASKISVGRFGYKVKNDYLLSEIREEYFDGIIFIGGNGSLDYLENDEAKKLAQNFLVKNKLVGAICAAPRLLLHWGILKDRHCTGWNGDSQLPVLCAQNGAIFEDKEVVRDGNFVTGNGPAASEQFALEVINILKS